MADQHPAKGPDAALPLRFDGWQIRPYARSDVAALVRCANSAEVAASLRDRFPHPYTKSDARRWIDIARAESRPTSYAIATAGTQAGSEPSCVIGGIGVQPGLDVHYIDAELGYWLGVDYWGRGIATAAVRAFTEWAFVTFEEIQRIHAFVFEHNPASARVLEKAGYSLEGRLRRSVEKGGVVQDQWLYARLRGEPGG